MIFLRFFARPHRLITEKPIHDECTADVQSADVKEVPLFGSQSLCFESIPANTVVENKYYRVYNTILSNERFPEDIFTIGSQYTLSSAQTGGIGAINFVLESTTCPFSS
ncbi:uncharacterized protein BT62DRAFT_693983 [Guyanagaster necrorhizus]|uniref:Uncharacterized protein n=1 Tax=Guyanagaster necrorhizus TaxID=856835 RepID=A0A9P7VEW7_9AGAR|nr:uncharacterized protein BT62DRAFT_693983 [Guyanagaster necrorhizus MCA 3950]KAG7439663.1 hypothetical protein BT62DRAFT_693983 [Guyanagaster necrorhizus MCA 3950]